MKTKLVLWGTNAQEERVMMALQLRSDENKVDIWTFPEAVATPEFSRIMLDEWRVSHKSDVTFPEETTHTVRELSVTESLLPDDLKPERADIIQRAQTEWHFIVLSTKLHENYKSELNQINDTVNKLTEYSGEVWDSLKGFWNKVQEQVRDRNLFREHADTLRDSTNGLFDQLKTMRTSLSNEFEENSKTLYSKFNEILDEIERKVENGIQRFPEIFEELKRTQSDFRNQKLTREHSNEIWTRLDNTFKNIKEKKFGATPQGDGSAVERLTRRFEGLIGAVDKMQDSINRDKEELDFQQKRMNNSYGQLEAQIRQAKITMIQERVKSKEVKLKEMLETKDDVESKLNSAKSKEAKKEAREPKPENKASEKIENVAIVETTENVEAKMAVETEEITAVTPPQSETVISTEVVETESVIEAPASVEAIEAVIATEVVETESVTEAPASVEAIETVVETPVQTVTLATSNGTSDIATLAADVNAALEAIEKVS